MKPKIKYIILETADQLIDSGKRVFIGGVECVCVASGGHLTEEGEAHGRCTLIPKGNIPIIVES